METITLIGLPDKWQPEIIGIIGVPNIKPNDHGPIWVTIILPTGKIITGVKYEGNENPDFITKDMIVQGSRLGELKNLVTAMINENKSFIINFGDNERKLKIQWLIKMQPKKTATN